MAHTHITDREEWYSRDPKVPEQEASKSIKIAPKAKGELSSGYSKLAMPAPLAQGHAQTKSERSSVGARYRTDGKLHGKASPSSEESFLKQRASKESHTK